MEDGKIILVDNMDAVRRLTNPEIAIKKTKGMKTIEVLLNIPLEKFLRHEYETYKLDTRQISKKIFKLTAQRISHVTVSRWLKKCNINLRKQCWE